MKYLLRTSTLIINVVTFSVLVGCTGIAISPLNPPVYDRISLKSVVIHTLSLPGAPVRKDAALLSEELSLAASQKTAEVILRQRISRTVEDFDTADPANASLFLFVNIPTSLPKEIRGSTAALRAGVFAGGKLDLHVEKHPDKVAICTVDWNDLKWSHGNAKWRRSRSVDAVILEGVNAVVESCVIELQRQFLD